MMSYVKEAEQGAATGIGKSFNFGCQYSEHAQGGDDQAIAASSHPQ